MLREYVPGNIDERFLTTYHERDHFTGLDYRGARFYDSDVGRFLSLDPLAADFAGWSPYNYVLGNPIKFVDPTGKSAEDTDPPPIGFSQMSYTLNDDYSHTISHTKELSTTKGSVVTRTVTNETIALSNSGEVLSVGRVTNVSQAEIKSERTVANPLDGMETTTNVVGEFKEVSSTQEQSIGVGDLNGDLQGVVSTIQENTEHNQRYDYMQRDAPEEGFLMGATYGIASLAMKVPGPVKVAGGIVVGAAAYHNSTRDNRGRTIYTIPKVETK